MPASEARLAANRRNGLKSTGPRTPEGKARSRANGLKHGLTGQGVVLPESDIAEVERRDQALRREMAPKSELGAMLVRKLAMLSVRSERAANQEFAAIAERVRHAAEDFDEARVDRAEQLHDALGEDPRGNLRRLRRTPEGVDRLVRAWERLRADLGREVKPAWTAAHLVEAANLLGFREDEARWSHVGTLSRAIWGDFPDLDRAEEDDEAAHEAGRPERDRRKAEARRQLLDEIDAEIADLHEHAESIDRRVLAQDRAEAGLRAQFDPSPEASRARRYESEADRGFYKALAEFRKVEAEAHAHVTAPAPAPTEAAPPAPLASSCVDDAADLDEGAEPTSRPALAVVPARPEAPRAAGRPPRTPHAPPDRRA